MTTKTEVFEGVAITCGFCGRDDDLFAFTQAEVTGALPRGRYQCPSCKRAWEMQVVEKARVFNTGLVIPAKRKAVEVCAVL